MEERRPTLASISRKRAQGLRAAALALAAAACSDAAPGGAAARPDDVHRPNVVVVVLDTVRADRCSAFGYERPTTPTLEALAKESVRYTNAWSPAGWTGPAHASLFTGLRPAHHGFVEHRRPVLSLDNVTLAEVLRDHGYRRAAYSCNLVVSDEFGLLQGFEAGARLPPRNDRGEPSMSPDAHAAALAFVRESKAEGKPFLLFVNDIEPHLTYDPPDEWVDRFVRDRPAPEVLAAARLWNHPETLDNELGLVQTPPEVLAPLSDLYDAEIAHLDAELAKLLDGLRAEGVLDDTLLVVTSDHGELFGEHGLWSHGFSLHRAIRHVPLVVRYPGAAGAGTVVSDLVRLEDVFPTALEVCGLPVPPGLDGASLRGDTSGRISRASWGPQRTLIPALHERHPGADPGFLLHVIEAVFDGRMHLMVRSDGHVELYDDEADPGETHDLSQERPDEVERLRALLDT